MINKEYDYIRGTTALNPKRSYEEEKRREERENFERQRKQWQRKEKEARIAIIKNILQVSFIALVLGVLTISRNSKVYKMQNDLITLKNEVQTVNSENEALRVNLLKFSSLSKIKEAAGEVGMMVPEKEDIITVNITKDFFASIRE